MPESAATIEIRLGTLQQLFNSLDPSPFHDRDLDQDAEEYIVDSTDEIPLQKPLTLIIHLPPDQLPADTFDLARAIHNYFAYRLAESRRRLRFYFRDGRISLLVGVAFLFACIALRQMVSALGPGTGPEIVAEGLLITGWVAMWRPLEIFLYEWWPIRNEARLYDRLSVMPVRLVGAGETAGKEA